MNRIGARFRLIKINLNGIVVFVAISMTRFLRIVLKKKDIADVKNTIMTNDRFPDYYSNGIKCEI